MKTTIFFLLIIFHASFAATSDTQNVSMSISAINELNHLGGNITLTVNSATAGSDVTNVSNASTSLQWTTNQSSKKITVVSNLSSPNFTIYSSATSVSGGTSAGSQVLNNVVKNLVTTITKTTGSCSLFYQTSVSASDGTGTDIHTITYTLTS